MAKGYLACKYCQTRLLVVRGVPPLNYGQDPAGNVAVSIADPRRGRFLGRGEQAGTVEHQHTVHDCDGMRRARQRGRWSTVLAQQGRQRRNRRGRRPGKQPTGYVIPPPLPGMPKPPPGRNP